MTERATADEAGAPRTVPPLFNEDDAEIPEVFSSDDEGVARAFESVKPIISECFSNFAETVGESGDVTFQFVIPSEKADGSSFVSASDVRVADATLNATVLQACWLTAFAELRFEPPPRNREVSYEMYVGTLGYVE